MNWMIDGAYGDLYRTAIGHRDRKPATDEWEIERTLGERQPSPGQRLARLAARGKSHCAHFFDRIAVIATAVRHVEREASKVTMLSTCRSR